MQLVELNVDDEVKALGDALKVLVSDIKDKKSIAQIAADALPGLLAGVAGFAALGGDLKKVDNQAYLLKCLGDALEAAPVA